MDNSTTRTIRIVVDASKARSGSEESRQALKRMEDQVAATRSSMDKLSAGWGGMMRGFAAAAAILAAVNTVKAFATGIAEAGDMVSLTATRLNVLTNAAHDSREAFQQVFALSQRTGTALADTAGSFSTLAIAAGSFGASAKEVERVTEAVIKLSRIGGSSADQVKTVLQQLGQGIASGTFQGDELRSVRENSPLVARAIAREFGVAVGELKRLGEEGKLSGERVFRGLEKGLADADREFKKLPDTVEQAAARSTNAMTLVSAELGKWTGLSALFVSRLNQGASVLETIARGIGLLNDPSFKDKTELESVTGQINDLRARQGRPRSFFGSLLGTETGKIDEELAALEARRTAITTRQAQRAADHELALAQQGAAQEQARRDAANSRVTALEEKALTGSAKATRDYDQAIKQLDADKKAGLITQDRYNQGVVAAKKVLAEAAGGAKATAESVKALNEATREADFAKLLADSAYLGAGRLAEIEAQAKAAEKAIDTLGKRDATFEGRYAGQLLSKRGDDYRKEFRTETLELERQNQLLEAQVRLAGERPEIAEREIALLRVRLDLEAKGQKIGEDDLQRRVDALTAQEKLNRQLEDGKRSAELWAEPFKNAIQSVQSTMTDFFEKLFNGSIKGFSDLAAAGKAIWFRLMAEMASVAVIRPVIQFAVGGASSLGLIGPQTAQAFGVTGGGGSGGGAGSSLTGGGGFNPFGMFGSGGFDGMLGRVGGFLSSPISGFPSAAAFEGVIPGMSGSAAQQYFNGASGGGLFGTTTWGQGLGALAGFSSGIFQLATGGGSTGSIIGGIGSMIGAGVSLIPGIGQIAGPIISIVSSILPGLFKKEPNYAAQGFHSYNPATGRYGARVGFEENMKAPLAPGVGNDALKLISAFGGSVAPGMSAPEYYIWRGFKDGRMDATVTAEGSPTYKALLEKVWASGQIRTTDEAQWAARTELWTDSPVNGEWTPLPVNSLTGDSDKLMQQLALLILKAGVRDGSFTGLSDTSQRIIRNYPDADTKGLGEALQWGKSTYDQLVRTDTITAAEKAFADLRDSFQAAILKAEEYRLATDKLTEAQSRALNKYASDFGRNIEDQLLGIADPAALQRLQIEREREQALKEWDYLQQEFLKGNISTLIERNKVQQLYDEKLKSIFSQTLASLENFERRVRFGDLSAANPLESLAGTLGAYKANAAQALTGNATAINQYEAFAEAAIRAQAAYGGNDYAAADLRRQILEEIAAIQGRAGGAPVPAVNELIETNQEIARLMRELLDRMQSG